MIRQHETLVKGRYASGYKCHNPATRLATIRDSFAQPLWARPCRLVVIRCYRAPPHSFTRNLIYSLISSTSSFSLGDDGPEMAALQCRDCVTGTLHTDVPTGIESTVHDIPTYIARPNEGQPENGLIIYITDIFGWEFPNNRLLADRYAKKGGYVVYIPDFLRGRSAQMSIFSNKISQILEDSHFTTRSRSLLRTSPLLCCLLRSLVAPLHYLHQTNLLPQSNPNLRRSCIPQPTIKIQALDLQLHESVAKRPSNC
jgi:hypothetical protein